MSRYNFRRYCWGLRAIWCGGNIDKTDKLDDSDNYLLPENEETLYEKKFNETILRFSKVDNVLTQNMLVHVLRSKDNGKSFYVVSDNCDSSK